MDGVHVRAHSCMEKIKFKLSKRLRAAAELVRDGAYIADIGTDHAYLPVALCLEGRARGAVASDINEGPISHAREHINKYGLSGKIDAILADGLCAAEPYAPDDILILGMGGELIADILSRVEFIKNEKIRLILQPMTHAEAVRAFLCENGYAIVDEVLVRDDKIYQIICAEYTGETESYTDVELLLGRKNIERGGELFFETVERFKGVFSQRMQGKKKAMEDTSEEEKMLRALEELK